MSDDLASRVATLPSGTRIRRTRTDELAGLAGPALTPHDSLALVVPGTAEQARQLLEEAGIEPVTLSEATQESVDLTVQFPDRLSLTRFMREANRYRGDAETEEGALPRGIRNSIFDSIEWIGTLGRDEKIGQRLAETPATDEDAFFDVDLWHLGGTDSARFVEQALRGICQRNGARVVSTLRTRTMILARISGTRSTIDALLDLDLVAYVNRPPSLPLAQNLIFEPQPNLPPRSLPTGTEPVITVIDSGVLSAHPLLAGWVLDEIDFDSGEDTPADQQGHGTGVAALAAYGDVARCLETGLWNPQAQICSAKVLRRDPVLLDRAVFPENSRAEEVVLRAIRHFHGERGSRVFNISIGNSDEPFRGGSQFPWAESLDQIARDLDILIIVSAGNISPPALPTEPQERADFQVGALNVKLGDDLYRVCNPGTAAIAVTVGGIARSGFAAQEPLVVGFPGGSSPFSRVGPGYGTSAAKAAIKPEFVAFGGNCSARGNGDGTFRTVVGGFELGEPTARLEFGDGRSITTAFGTSYAAPQVSHTAALALRPLREALSAEPSANSIRALLGATSRLPESDPAHHLDPDGNESDEKRRLIGNGVIDSARIRSSIEKDVLVIAEDEIPADRWHLFRIPVPASLMRGRGLRGITAALAFDPPVLASRAKYLSRTMWFELLRGLTSQDVVRLCERGQQSRAGDSRLHRNSRLAMRPTQTEVSWSTLQVRRIVWRSAPRFRPIGQGEVACLHALVGCHERFVTGDEAPQRYSLALRFWHDDDSVTLHTELASTIRRRVAARVRVDRRG
ncbi:MAG: S8 family peptidase [Planctomycetes bacterium]|nr:S8 family peptidase [Planctomycetota bacterium]